MPAINFNEQFKHKIVDGSKSQTIRRSGKREFNVGDKLSLYTGLRTKQSEKLAETQIKMVRKLEFNRLNGKMRLIIDDKQIIDQRDDLDAFAKKDGFEDWNAMYSWFSTTYGKELIALDFLLIEWNDVART